MSVKLMLVAANNGEGTNLDLFVEAEARDEAVKMWAQNFYEEDEPPEGSEIRVFEINPTGRAGAIEWGGPACKELK